MEPSSNPYDELEPLFNGLPVLVRLITKEDLMCILFQRYPEQQQDDARLYMERPLRFITDEVPVDDPQVTKQTGRSQTIYSTVRTRFDRWIPFTPAVMFPVYPDHVLSIAPLSDQYVNSYMNWADELYADAARLSRPPSPAQESRLLHDQTEEDIRRSYIDYLLHQFNPKGKPN